MDWFDPPGYIADLRSVIKDEQGVSWVGEAESREVTALLRAFYADGRSLGVLWSDALWSACSATANELQFIAHGPSYHKRLVGDQRSQFYVNPRLPGKVVFAPSMEVPTVLWVTVDATAAAVHSLLKDHFPGRRISATELPRCARAYMGSPHHLYLPHPLTGEVTPALPAALDRHWLSSPVVDEPCWGGAFDDDPLPSVIEPSLSPVYMFHELREARTQRGGAVARLTRRTLFSGSLVTVEMHDEGDYVWELNFKPNHYPEVVERLNEICGTKLPTELPIDVAGAVIGFEYQDAETLEARLDRAAEALEICVWLQRLTEVRHEDLSVTEVLRRYIGHEHVRVREVVAVMSYFFRWTFLLENLGAQETDPELTSNVREMLIHGAGAPTFNEMGEADTFLSRAQELIRLEERRP